MKKQSNLISAIIDVVTGNTTNATSATEEHNRLFVMALFSRLFIFLAFVFTIKTAMLVMAFSGTAIFCGICAGVCGCLADKYMAQYDRYDEKLKKKSQENLFRSANAMSVFNSNKK